MPFDLASMSKQKLAFIGIAIVLFIGILYGASSLSSSSSKPKVKAPKELSIWVVGDETTGFSDIITGFKNRYPEYKNTEIKFTKFANYEDYEKTLLTVIADGNSPDIFVVNNNGGSLLESKIVGIPASVINPDEFSKNFNKVFDSLSVSSTEKGADGKDKQISGLKWVPLSYQALGVFYNWKLVRSVPHLWSELQVPHPTDTPTTDYTDILLGLDGRYVFGASDIYSLFALQNGIASYSGLTDAGGSAALDAYMSFSGATDATTLATLRSKMEDLNLSTLDLFVRGEVGMVVGFPSLMREIEYAVKRAGSNSVLASGFLRTTEIPQLSNDPTKAVNLVDYNYFALSKGAKSPDAGYAFLAFLSTREAEEKYLASFPYALPAQRIFEEPRTNAIMSKDYTRVKYTSFMNADVPLSGFDKGLKNEYDTYFSHSLGNTKITSTNLLRGAIQYIDCTRKHLLQQTSFDEECKMPF